jgi:hypothetical protein
MTDLYLHIGTEKTGSSFLQKVCAHNRERLGRRGIWFPNAGKYESMLMSGTVSPGNAYVMLQYILCGDWDSVAKWMSSKTSEAKRNNCGRLLLSNEVLFAALSEGDSLSRFLAAARASGIEDVQVLLLIRDPVDQALSLYKHRAKSGKTPSLSDWVESSYDYPLQIDALLTQVEAAEVKLTTRKYVKDSERMLHMYFEDWLGFEDELQVPEAIVNPSLTLSELRFLHHVAENRRDFVTFFYDELLAVAAPDKARDDDLEAAAREALSKKLSRYGIIWQGLDRRLKGDGGLELPEPGTDVGAEREQTYSLTDAQLKALARANDRCLEPKNQVKTSIEKNLLAPARRVLSRLAKWQSRS